jgi:hypothetical protein
MNKFGNEERAAKAKEHIKEMELLYQDDIKKSINESIIYNSKLEVDKDKKTENIIIENLDTVSAIFKHVDNKTAVLNFASFYNPGGGYIWGTMAQEEALCSESTLYNVLSAEKFKDYYSVNWNNFNDYLFYDKGIYSSNILFERNNEIKNVSVITVAAPNRRKQEKATKEENYEALKSRIEFIINIAKKNKIKTLILGAFGCGVFSQEPKEVAELFKKELENKYFNKVIYAIMPDKENLNFKIFNEVNNSN